MKIILKERNDGAWEVHVRTWCCTSPVQAEGLRYYLANRINKSPYSPSLFRDKEQAELVARKVIEEYHQRREERKVMKKNLKKMRKDARTKRKVTVNI